MPFQTDKEIDLTPRTDSKYIISSQHRKTGNPKKCIWTIDFTDEVECFINAKNRSWTTGTTGWGLKLAGTILQTVGINFSSEELKMAKFVDGDANNKWHGYPADYLNKTHDIPSTTVLRMWVNAGYIGKSHFLKIRQGKPCNL
jgi:hypothetical protein